MSYKSFDTSNAIGKAFEKKLHTWLDMTLGQAWIIKDTSDKCRVDGDQYPDFELYNRSSKTFFFVDAKVRKAYEYKGKRSFGFDLQFYTSYMNIAAKHNTHVVIAFNDPEFDPNGVYFLNLQKLQPDLRYNYNNDTTTLRSTRVGWYIDKLKRENL